MADKAQLARAQALLERTAQIIAAVEAEVESLHAENEARKARVLAWEETLLALLPETAAEEPIVHVEDVHDPDTVHEHTTAAGHVYTLDQPGVRTLPRD